MVTKKYGVATTTHTKCCLCGQALFEVGGLQPMKTRKFCPYCGRSVVKSRTKGYAFQCYGCDEDFYRFEVNTTRQIETVKHNRRESYQWCIALNRKTIRSFKKPYPKSK